ncbi:MAG: carboxypeptidase-like regulatory domain-containing protein [Aurantibacter sp.]
MEKFKKSFLIVLVHLSFFAHNVFAQIEISGKVMDKESGEPIPYCNISLESSSVGTASNELGEFIMVVDSLPIKLIFSHINYGPQVLDVSQTSELTVSLAALTTNLEEVVVSASKIDAFAMRLAKNAIEKAQKASVRDKYGRAFYRQKSKNGNEYSEFSEIFYDIRYNNVGIKDWNISEGRYALKENAVHNRNYTSFSRLLKPLQPNTDDLIFPLHPSFEAYYNPRVINTVQSGNSKIAVVHFRPIKNLKTPTFDGEVYIDTKTNDILKVSGALSRDDLKLAKLTTKDGHWKDYSIAYEIVYKRENSSKILLDYIKVDQSFDYYKNDKFQYNTSSTSNLIFYEHYAPTSRKKLGGRLARSQSDWKKLDEIGYNENFWAENPVVKRTPVEEEVISSFEKENAFSSIFLNSAENIALMSSNISEDPLIKELGKLTNLYNSYNPVEKVFLHTDKDLFSAGETIWLSAFVVVGPFHEYTNGSRVIHVDLIGPDGKIALSQTHGLINGRGSGSLEVPKNLPSGNYQLRAYTQWMRDFDADYFFTKNLDILNRSVSRDSFEEIEESIDLQFFPEGGHAVAELAAKVSFKAIGSDGLPRAVKGRIVDSGGKPVAAFNTFDRGAGFFQLMPKKGQQYVAELDDGTQYPLPKILDVGYTIAVNNLNEKSIKVIVQASEPLRAKPFYIIGHMRQRKYYQAKFEFGLNRTFTFEIPKTQMPSGVLTLTLFDADKKPWCERPVFVNNQEELVIRAKINTKKLVKRSKVVFDINVTDTEGRPVSTALSMAVTDAGQVNKNQNPGTILTQFLLESDIKGNIKDPGLLFKDQKRPTLQRLDLIMLTHGWRKYHWPEIWEEQIASKEFDFAEGLIISGRATSPNRKLMPNASLNLIAKSGEQLGMFSARTALDGTFSIPDFNFSGPSEVVFNAFDVEDRPLDLKVTLHANKMTVPPSRFKRPLLKQPDEAENYSAHAVARRRMHTIYESRKVTELDEVVVTEKKRENSRNQRPSVYGQSPDATLYTTDHVALHTVLQLVGLFPGVSVNGNTVSIRNRGTPLWVLDGIPVYNDNPSGMNAALAAQSAARSADNPNPPLIYTVAHAVAPGPVPSSIANMDTFTVERVEILKGASAAIYGSRGSNGVILVYTKRGEGQTIKPVLSPDFTISGHAVEKEFYSPKYDVKREEHIAPDYRATLYWNPSIATDENGSAKIEFFNSDTAKEVQVSIEGLSNYGIPGSYLETFGK